MHDRATHSVRSPPPCGEGLGVGVVPFSAGGAIVIAPRYPPPPPPPPGGREQTEFAACADSNSWEGALFHLLAHQVETLERGFVRHHEEVGIAAARLMAREGPMRDREHVVLRPFEGLFADARAALARDHETDHVVRRAFH